MKQDNINGKDLITSEEVETVVNGNQEALIAQLERAKQVALMQLEASKKKATNQVANAERQALEEEYKKREAELNAAKVALNMNLAPSTVNENKQASDKLAQEQEQKRIQVERDIQSRSNFQVGNNVYNSGNVLSQVQTTVSKKDERKKKKEADKLKKQQEKMAQETLIKKQRDEKEALKQQKLDQKKKAKEERRANSNFKYIMTIGLFIFLFALVYLLPYISNYLAKIEAERASAKESIVTTGNLECKMSKYSEKYDYIYESVFSFKDSKLLKLSYKVTTKGDREADLDDLNNMKDECDLLKSETKNLEGVTVRCSLDNGTVISEQVLDYQHIDVEMVNTSYLEAGLVYPNYSYQDNIDKIEKAMKASGYTCERVK